MAACSFDHTFLYVAAGWEGSASDMSVLRATLEDGKFNVPEGYANTSKFITPYRGSRYHLGDFANRTTRAYRDTKDKYNHRHAQLRNAVKKAWGILKQRFKILKVAVPFPYKTQVKIVVACCVLHNFIARHQGNDKYFNMLNGLEMNEDENEVEEEEDPQYMVGADESLRGEQLHNRIALQLWNN
ncbi:protein ALP1-like [Asparagus officinalis]|uniref:protein ALP1-like n=1 Tax=Asparagus officinalis TaxID=4686 RepID=UPI00098E596C|nr:protein ALP1-like [Asparagus officinalis]